MGAYLATHRPRRGEQATLAREVGCTTRALRTWRVRAQHEGPVRPAQRPRASMTSRALRSLVRLWRGLVPGHDGWRTLWLVARRAGLELGPRLVQRVVNCIKAKQAARERRRDEAQRVSVHVLARDALWACDESHLGRDNVGEVRGLAVRDACTSSTPWSSVGPPATDDELVRALERTADVRGGWPLVASFDNGRANLSQAVRELLERHQVIALVNLPHTPQHNAFVERAWGELKCAAELDEPALRAAERRQEAPVLNTRGNLEVRLEASRQALQHVPRVRLGGFTSEEIDSLSVRADDRVCRARFYADACAALDRVAHYTLKARARRRAERESILSTLEAHGLVVRTQGGGPSSSPSKRNDLV